MTRIEGSQPHAVVIGLDCVTGLQTARILRYRHGVPVIGIATDPRHPCCKTRSCEPILFTNTADGELVVALESLGQRLSAPAVLYPCTDLSVLQVSRARERLARWFRFALPEPAVLEAMVDKAQFYTFAKENRLAIPNTLFLDSRADVLDASALLKFPCLVKPYLKTAEWEKNVGAKVLHVSRPQDLQAVYDRCSPWALPLVAQEWVHGDDSNLFTCNCYFNRESQPLVTFVTQKLRQWPPQAGTGCFGQECRNDAVLQEAVRVFRQVRHHGFGYLEMKWDAQAGEYFIIEPNVGRPTGRSATAEAAGVDFLYTQYCDLLGLPLPERRQQEYRGVKWVYLRRDLQSALHSWRRGKLTLREWARSLRGPVVDALLSWKDPVPFFADALKALRALRADAHKARNGASVPATAGPTEQSPQRLQPMRLAVVDFDIHGLVGVRLINPSPRDAASVRRQLGRLERPLNRPPDILIRFVDSVATPGLQHVEMGRSGFTRDGFFILQSRKQPAKVRIDFDQIGGPCEILCQTGAASVPHLLAIINLRLLAKDCVAVHASAFEHAGTGVLVTGWAKGGKTEALLAFARKGAKYVGDEWVILTSDGEHMLGIPEHIRLQDWHLRQLPEVRKQVPVSDRLFFRAIRALDGWQQKIPAVAAGKFYVTRRLREALPALRRQLNAQLDPQAVFGEPLGPYAGVPQKLFFMTSHPEPEIRIEPVAPGEIAKRMAASVRYEQLPIFAAYLAFRFAFPDRPNEFLERAHERQFEILSRALHGKNAYAVRHPYPCSLDELYEQMSPFCGPAPRTNPAQVSRSLESDPRMLVPMTSPAFNSSSD